MAELDRSLTLEEVSGIYGWSKERVRQIEEKAIRKLLYLCFLHVQEMEAPARRAIMRLMNGQRMWPIHKRGMAPGSTFKKGGDRYG